MSKLLHVFNVRPWINSGMAVRTALAPQFQNARAETAKEHAVMRNEDHGAFKILQGVYQHLLGRKIQVIRRFVEHQEVWRVVEHARYCQPRFFSARECADLLIYVFAGELKCSCQVPQRPETVL